MAEWSIAAVLKTVDCNRSGGSNPSFSAKIKNLVNHRFTRFFCFATTLRNHKDGNQCVATLKIGQNQIYTLLKHTIIIIKKCSLIHVTIKLINELSNKLIMLHVLIGDE